MRHAFVIDGHEHEVWLSRHADQWRLHTSGTSLLPPVALSVELRPADSAATPSILRIDGRDTPVVIATHGDDVFIHLDGNIHHLRHRHPLDRAAADAHGAAQDEARAPMPGTVVSLHTRPGQQVYRGEALLVMESMKLETTIAAWRDGVVRDVHVALGQVFDRDALLVTFEAALAASQEPAGLVKPTDGARQ